MKQQLNKFDVQDQMSATATNVSKFSPSPGMQSPGRDLQGIPIKDTLSLDDITHKSVGYQDDALVKFGVDMTQLSEYLDNIIKVVNQHAKLLDKVSDELEVRPKAT